MTWLALAVVVVGVSAVVAYVVGRKHVHEWIQTAATVTDVYGDGFGHMTDLPVRSYTDVSGICRTCHKPLHKRVKGDWGGRNEGVR